MSRNEIEYADSIMAIFGGVMAYCRAYVRVLGLEGRGANFEIVWDPTIANGMCRVLEGLQTLLDGPVGPLDREALHRSVADLSATFCLPTLESRETLRQVAQGLLDARLGGHTVTNRAVQWAARILQEGER